MIVVLLNVCVWVAANLRWFYAICSASSIVHVMISFNVVDETYVVRCGGYVILQVPMAFEVGYICLWLRDS